MKNSIVFLLIVIGCLTFSCAQNQSKTSKINEDKLLERLEILSSDKFEGRKTGEKGNDSARAYIIQEFKSLNISGFNGSFEHSFTFETRDETYNAFNVLAEIRGTETPDKYIVISAHHDHLGIKNGKIYNGADDDASGISALISFGEYLVKNPPKHSVIFAAFDAEELGLQGAKHFVNTIDKESILVNLNMDMISRSVKNELYVVGGRYNEKLKQIINELENTTPTKLLEGHDGSDDKQDWTLASDHGSFHKVKIPFLYFGNEDHAAYHKPTDDFKDITPQFYKNSVHIILSIFESIDLLGL